MPLPREILEASERVMDYHRSSKLTERSKPIAPDLASRPGTSRVYDFAPHTPLPNKLLDVNASVLAVLERGLEAIPESQHSPPQNLRTLATWLHLSAGQRQRVQMPWGPAMLRATPSADMAYPCEIYVAALAIEGLAPGLYHYSLREHALRQLRDGAETLSLLRRGRPDLQFLATVPAAVLVSTVFCRSSWLQGRRGYRQALIDAGHTVANLHAVANGIGMSTHARLRMTDGPMRELIGIPDDADYATSEAVHAMVIWADGANAPMPASPPPAGELATIPRPATGECVQTYGSILAVHHDVVSTGVAIREVRPPLTDMSPVPSSVRMERLAEANKHVASRSLRAVLLTPRFVEAFAPRPMSRDQLVRLSRASMRGGTYFPLKPEGTHVALVRPFWLIHDVTGQEPGIWWYDPLNDKWAQLNHGHYKHEMGALSSQRDLLRDASAICVLVSNLKRLLTDAGPDLYRLANLEAGIVAQRINLAASSMDQACRIFGDFYDDAVKTFLGLGATGWEPLALCAVGGAPGVRPAGEISEGGQSLELRD